VNAKNRNASKQTENDVTTKTADIAKKLAAARGALTTALLCGDPTAKLREYVRELEAEQAALEAAAQQQQANQEAAQQALEAITRNRIAESAQTLADARSARLAALTRPIPDTRSSSHA
jgi:hypothetical protein